MHLNLKNLYPDRIAQQKTDFLQKKKTHSKFHHHNNLVLVKLH